jgi:translation initiation factor eIF-2B subunit beta
VLRACVAAAAKHYSVPFVVVAGLYKLCPLYAFDQDTFNEHVAPTQILKFEDASFSAAAEGDRLDVVNPAYDYVPPELVTLFVTNEYARSAHHRTRWTPSPCG